MLREFAEAVASACEFVCVGFVALGAIEALTRTAGAWRRFGDLQFKKQVWLRFAAAIALSLEFALAADIVRTVIAPTWADLGQLAAIAAIRTALNLFLERDMAAIRKPAAQAMTSADRRARP